MLMRFPAKSSRLTSATGLGNEGGWCQVHVGEAGPLRGKGKEQYCCLSCHGGSHACHSKVSI